MIVYFKVKQFERSFSDMALLALVNTKNEIQGKTLLIQPLQNMGEDCTFWLWFAMMVFGNKYLPLTSTDTT